MHTESSDRGREPRLGLDGHRGQRSAQQKKVGQQLHLHVSHPITPRGVELSVCLSPSEQHILALRPRELSPTAVPTECICPTSGGSISPHGNNYTGCSQPSVTHWAPSKSVFFSANPLCREENWEAGEVTQVPTVSQHWRLGERKECKIALAGLEPVSIRLTLNSHRFTHLCLPSAEMKGD